jgi:hypothetical protein
MAISAATLAPRVVVTAVVSYCIWPSLSVMLSPPTPPPPVKQPELAESLLSPKMLTPPSRNVFFTKAAEEAVVKEMRTAAAKAKAAGKGQKGSEADSTPDKPPVNPLLGLKLEATYIAGNSRLALINGHVYAVRDNLPSVANAKSKVTIVDVRPEEVLLAFEGKSFVLTYTDVTSSVAAAHSAPSSAGKSAPRSKPSSTTRK